jgi:hypothetical protein
LLVDGDDGSSSSELGRSRSKRQSGRKEADSPPILINGVFSAVPDAGLRTAAPSLGPNVGISKSSWDDLAPGLARGKPCRVSSRSKSVDAAPRLGAREERAPSRLAGAGQGSRVHHHSALRPRPRARPPSAHGATLANPTGAVSKSPKMLGRAVQGPPRRPNATERSRIGRSAHQFSDFRRGRLGFVNRPHWQSLGAIKDQGHDPVCHSYRGNARPKPCRALGSLCQQRRKGKKRSADGILALAWLVHRPSPLSRVNTGIFMPFVVEGFIVVIRIWVDTGAEILTILTTCFAEGSRRRVAQVRRHCLFINTLYSGRYILTLILKEKGAPSPTVSKRLPR